MRRAIELNEAHQRDRPGGRPGPLQAAMNVVIVNHSEVRQLLPMEECIEVMGRALESLARGEALQPLRAITWLPDRRGGLGLMPGHLGNPPSLGAKVVTVFPGNLDTPYESHQGVVLLFDPQDGRLLALVDAGELTGIRTAAVSGLATRLLAREESSDLALLGSGAQAASHLEAMLAVRKIRRVRVWSRSGEHARAFAERAGRRHRVGVEVRATAEEAVREADVICTVTGASEPVLRGEWLAPGAHINAVGACTPRARELDGAAIAGSLLFVDRRESAENEAGDLIMARAEGAITDDQIAGELGELLLGNVTGRSSPDQITLFESLGLAVEDLAAAYHVYAAALARAAGTVIEIGGLRHQAP